jgi:hypothetical protein
MERLYKDFVSILIILFVFNLAVKGQIINNSYSVTGVNTEKINNENMDYFSIGWCNYLYHFTVNHSNYKYPNRYLFSNGYEFIATYHLNSGISFSTGLA